MKRSTHILRLLFPLLLAFPAVASLAYGQAGTVTTPNIHLIEPPVGEHGWGPQVNANMTAIDTAIGALQNPYQGQWNGTQQYTRGQMVSYNSNVYIATAQTNVNQEPDTSNSWQSLGSSYTYTLTKDAVTGLGPLANNISGTAAKATALAAAGTPCPVVNNVQQVPTGVDASGNAVGCFTPQSSGGANITPTANVVQMGNAQGNNLADSNLHQSSDGTMHFVAGAYGVQNTLDDGTGASSQGCFFTSPSNAAHCATRQYASFVSGYDRYPGNQAGLYGFQDNYLSKGTGIRGYYAHVSEYDGLDGDVNDDDSAFTARGNCSNPADECVHKRRTQIFETEPAYGTLSVPPGGVPAGTELYDNTQPFSAPGCVVDGANGQNYCGVGINGFGPPYASAYFATHGAAALSFTGQLAACFRNQTANIGGSDSTCGPNGYGLVFYDANKNFLSLQGWNLTPQYTYANSTLPVPGGAAYFRFTYYSGYFDTTNGMIVAGSTVPTSYVPYNPAAFVPLAPGADSSMTFTAPLYTIGTGGPIMDRNTALDLTVTAVTATGGTYSNTGIAASTNGTLAGGISIPAGTQDEDGLVTTFNANLASDPAGNDVIISGSSLPEKFKPMSTSLVSTGVYAITAKVREAHNAGDQISFGGLAGRLIRVEAGTGQSIASPLPTLLDGTPNDHMVWITDNDASGNFNTGYDAYGATWRGYMSTGIHTAFQGAMVWDVRDPGAGNQTSGTHAVVQDSTTPWRSGDIVEQPNQIHQNFDLDHTLMQIHSPYIAYTGHTDGEIGGSVPLNGQWWETNFVQGSALTMFYFQGGFGSGMVSDASPTGGITQNTCNMIAAYLCTGEITGSFSIWTGQFPTNDTSVADDVGAGGIFVNATTHRLQMLGTDFNTAITISGDAQAACGGSTNNASCGAYSILLNFAGPTPGFEGTKFMDGPNFMGRDGYVRQGQGSSGLTAQYASDGNPISATITTNFIKQLHGGGYTISAVDNDSVQAFVMDGGGNLTLGHNLTVDGSFAGGANGNLQFAAGGSAGYSNFTLNGNNADTTRLGFVGAPGDNHLYVDVPAGGYIAFRFGSTSVAAYIASDGTFHQGQPPN